MMPTLRRLVHAPAKAILTRSADPRRAIQDVIPCACRCLPVQGKAAQRGAYRVTDRMIGGLPCYLFANVLRSLGPLQLVLSDFMSSHFLSITSLSTLPVPFCSLLLISLQDGECTLPALTRNGGR